MQPTISSGVNPTFKPVITCIPICGVPCATNAEIVVSTFCLLSSPSREYTSPKANSTTMRVRSGATSLKLSPTSMCPVGLSAVGAVSSLSFSMPCLKRSLVIVRSLYAEMSTEQQYTQEGIELLLHSINENDLHPQHYHLCSFFYYYEKP